MVVRVVITGGPGGGKTTLVKRLAADGFAVMPESGRAVIIEQRAAGGDALPWRDRDAFAASMVDRDVAAWHAATKPVTFFDRGVVDTIGYLTLEGLAVPTRLDEAARRLRYHDRVFVTPWWPDIYELDAERRQTPEVARATEIQIGRTYREYGYEVLPLPLDTPAVRAAFVRDHLD
ncbi:AAA family ATPase [Stackebrandtia soli]|uniref:AAA family ATPase n=1 Tax=Stackebrandtia soli TaxID=1892856 RepID=UPI0039E8E280